MKQPCNAHAYEQEKKEQQKQFLIDMMEEAEKLGLYDIFNDEKRQGVKDLIDTHKQRLEKYSERFDNDKSAIGNPDTWGRRVVEEPKQETLEEATERIYDDNLFDYQKYRNGFIKGAKWQQERSYSEEEVKDMLFEALNKKQEQCCITNTKDSIVREVLKQFKNK